MNLCGLLHPSLHSRGLFLPVPFAFLAFFANRIWQGSISSSRLFHLCSPLLVPLYLVFRLTFPAYVLLSTSSLRPSSFSPLQLLLLPVYLGESANKQFALHISSTITTPIDMTHPITISHPQLSPNLPLSVSRYTSPKQLCADLLSRSPSLRRPLPSFRLSPGSLRPPPPRLRRLAISRLLHPLHHLARSFLSFS